MNIEKLRFIPLGGVVGVTKNMYLYEFYVKSQSSNLKSDKSEKFDSEGYILQDILIVDCGIGFPVEKELGVDFVIPDISYLTDKIDKIRAIILSHGHEDHTSALPYLYHSLGQPPIFASRLTSVFVENKLAEFGIRTRINQISFDKEYQWGNFKVNFIKMTHSIPDTVHILIKTPLGAIYHGTDFKLDLTPPYGPPPDFYAIAKAGHQGVLALLSDCLGAEREGLTSSEAVVGKTFEDEMRLTRGKFIMTTFSSNISRIRQCVEAAIRFNRKIVFLGRSMKENSQLASSIGYLPIPYDCLLKEEEAVRYPSEKLCLIAAGSQGQHDSALAKLVNRKNPYFKIKPGDKVIFSSDPIPGNENEVYALIEDLVLQGADVVYPDIAEQLHSSGHGNQEDLKFLIRFTNPKYFIPIGGTARHQRQYQKLVAELGYPKENVFMLDEGESVCFVKNKRSFAKASAFKGEKIETKNIYVDAYGIGDVGRMVLRDRKTLATEGMVVVILAIDRQGRLITRPKIVSRGFVFEKEEDILYDRAIRLIERITKPKGGRININNLKQNIINQLEEFFFKERGREPLVVVEMIEI